MNKLGVMMYFEVLVIRSKLQVRGITHNGLQLSKYDLLLAFSDV